ncbi:hypothetical protein Sjap_024269 [Stephania japonica]|uniref:Uncharacterized protein n=1 Tax=Stephania japonica TaxID=461633 RepID=A0AAP0HNJ6_9MAGN
MTLGSAGLVEKTGADDVSASFDIVKDYAPANLEVLEWPWKHIDMVWEIPVGKDDEEHELHYVMKTIAREDIAKIRDLHLAKNLMAPLKFQDKGGGEELLASKDDELLNCETKAIAGKKCKIMHSDKGPAISKNSDGAFEISRTTSRGVSSLGACSRPFQNFLLAGAEAYKIKEVEKRYLQSKDDELLHGETKAVSRKMRKIMHSGIHPLKELGG